MGGTGAAQRHHPKLRQSVQQVDLMSLMRVWMAELKAETVADR
jgi:hypothetical protein